MADNKKSLSGGNGAKLALKVLIIIVGIVALVLSYFLGYSAFAEQTAAVNSEVSTLQAEVAVLNAMNAKQDDYVKEMDDMNNQVAYVEKKFPSMIKAEDVIIYSDALEKVNEMKISGVNIEEAQLTYTTANGDEVVMDVATEENAEGETEVSPEDELKAEYAKYSITEDYYYDLYEVPVTYSFTVAYENLKRAIEYIRSSSDTQSIKTVALAYNAESGDLTGTITVGDYVLVGSDAGYVAPSLPEIPVGTLNPFTGLGNDKVDDETTEEDGTVTAE